MATLTQGSNGGGSSASIVRISGTQNSEIQIDDIEQIQTKYQFLEVIDSRSSPRRPLPEIIDLTTNDDNCFWEYDVFGKVTRSSTKKSVPSHGKTCNAASSFNNEDAECVDADHTDGSSSIEDVTEYMISKRSEEVQKRIHDAEEIGDSDEDSSDSQRAGKGKRRKV